MNLNIEKTKVTLKVGDRAPIFKAKIQRPSKEVEIFDLKEKLKHKIVLLVFYPGDDTPGCTKQLCGIRDVYSEYLKYNVEVVGVNPADNQSHLSFIEKYNFPFGIIIDEDKSIREKYGAVSKFFKATITKRSVFLIGQDGLIKYIFKGQQDNQKIIDLLKTINN